MQALRLHTFPLAFCSLVSYFSLVSALAISFILSYFTSFFLVSFSPVSLLYPPLFSLCSTVASMDIECCEKTE